MRLMLLLLARRGAGLVAPSFELSACGTNGRFRCVGESEIDVDDLGPGDAVADVWCPSVTLPPPLERVRCAYDASVGAPSTEKRRLVVFYAARHRVLVGLLHLGMVKFGNGIQTQQHTHAQGDECKMGANMGKRRMTMSRELT